MADTELTQTQIELISERATKFLSGASQVSAIRSALDRGGYTEEEHKQGWEALLELLGYRMSLVANAPKLQRASEATAELDQWDGENFERSRAALEHRYPDQAAYVFHNLTAKSGSESIGTVRTYLDRVAALRDGTDPARSATRAEDKAATELLAKRRILDANEEQRLRGLISEAMRLADLPAPIEPDPGQRQQTARKLDAWLRDWRASARVLVTRRDHQIRLGLAERRAPKGERTAPATPATSTAGGTQD